MKETVKIISAEMCSSHHSGEITNTKIVFVKGSEYGDVVATVFNYDWVEEYGNDIRGVDCMYVGNVRKMNISASYRTFEIGDEIEVSEEFENAIIDSVIKRRHINVIHCKNS
jgi:hypothetical protein